MIYHVTLTPIPSGRPIVRRFTGKHRGKARAFDYASLLIGEPPCHGQVTIFEEEAGTILLDVTIFPQSFIEACEDSGSKLATVKRLLAR